MSQSTSFQVVVTKSASKDIDKLDPVVRKKIYQKIKLYSQTPLAYAKHLHNSQIGTYRWRIGNYRIIFDLDQNTIVLLKIDHRSQVYQS